MISIHLPFLHIADALAGAIRGAGLCTVGLLGTKFTMEENFYKDRLESALGHPVLTPNEHEREIVHNIIYDELCMGQVLPASRRQYARIMERLAEEGAEGIVLGCTEIPMLVKTTDAPVPLFDTTHIHACKAVDWALAEEG